MKYRLYIRSDNVKNTEWKVHTVGSFEDVISELFQLQGYGRDYADQIRIEWDRSADA